MRSSTFSLGLRKIQKTMLDWSLQSVGGGGGEMGRDEVYGAKCNLNEKRNNM